MPPVGLGKYLPNARKIRSLGEYLVGNGYNLDAKDLVRRFHFFRVKVESFWQVQFHRLYRFDTPVRYHELGDLELRHVVLDSANKVLIDLYQMTRRTTP